MNASEPRWTHEHVIRVTALITPSSAAASATLARVLGDWFESLTHLPPESSDSSSSDGSDPRYFALDGGSALERHHLLAEKRDLAAHLVMVTSGGEDGIDSAETDVQELRERVRKADPSALIVTTQQWSENGNDWFPAPFEI